MKIHIESEKKETNKFLKFLERNPVLVLGICIAIVAVVAFIAIIIAVF